MLFNQSTNIQKFNKLEYVKWIGQNILELYCDYLILIPSFTDYERLQRIETSTLDAVGEFKLFSDREIFKRNKTINAFEYQNEIIKSYSQNSNGLLFDKSEILQQTRVEEN